MYLIIDSIKKILSLRRIYKQLIVLTNDIFFIILSTWIAFSIRLGSVNFPNELELLVYLIATLSLLPLLLIFKVYHSIFRYGGIAAIRSISYAVICHSIIFYITLDYLALYNIPRSIAIYQPIFFLLVTILNRSTIILVVNYLNQYRKKINILIYGSDDISYKTAISLLSSNDYKLFGFVDQDKDRAGKKILGLPILSYKNLFDFIKRNQINQLVIAKGDLRTKEVMLIVEKLENYNVHIKTLQLNTEDINEEIRVSDIGNLKFSEIIGEKEVYKNAKVTNELKNKKILITGAGGSIGSELTRQILNAQPSEIILIDHNEYGLFEIGNQIEKLQDAKKEKVAVSKFLGSIKDYNRMKFIFDSKKPNQVFHAAAYKHVGLVEENIIEGITNNIFGSKNIINLSIESESVEKFVLISTDKAVRPKSLMGKTKRIIEMYLQLCAQENHSTKLAIVRFGNVFNSSGSVVPLFQKQIENGGPVTVTSKEASRYFMSIPEAVSLILLASIESNKGEIFILDMGEPIKIFDLAKKIIRSFGLKEKLNQNDEGDILIKFIGLRKGEKEHEELMIGDNYKRTANNLIFIASEPVVQKSIFNELMDDLEKNINSDNNNLIKAINNFF